MRIPELLIICVSTLSAIIHKNHLQTRKKWDVNVLRYSKMQTLQKTKLHTYTPPMTVEYQTFKSRVFLRQLPQSMVSIIKKRPGAPQERFCMRSITLGLKYSIAQAAHHAHVAPVTHMCSNRIDRFGCVFHVRSPKPRIIRVQYWP